MSHNRAHDLLLLLACGMPAACGPATEPSDGSGGGGGGNAADVDDAIAACGAWATKQTACFEENSTSGGYYYGYAGNYLSNLGYCFLYLGYAESTGPACRGAIEEQFACLATLDCDELIISETSDDSGGNSEPEPERPCAMEQAAVEAQCDVDDGDSDDDDVDAVTSGG